MAEQTHAAAAVGGSTHLVYSNTHSSLYLEFHSLAGATGFCLFKGVGWYPSLTIRPVRKGVF